MCWWKECGADSLNRPPCWSVITWLVFFLFLFFSFFGSVDGQLMGRRLCDLHGLMYCFTEQKQHWLRFALMSLWLITPVIFFPLMRYNFWKSIKLSSSEFFLLCQRSQSPNTFKFNPKVTSINLFKYALNIFKNTPPWHSVVPWAKYSYHVGVCLFLVFRPNLAQDGAHGVFAGICSCELISPTCANECV